MSLGKTNMVFAGFKIGYRRPSPLAFSGWLGRALSFRVLGLVRPGLVIAGDSLYEFRVVTAGGYL